MADATDDHDDVTDDDGTPRWVKVFGTIALVVVLLFLGLMIFGSHNGHGPRRHLSSVAVGGHALQSGVVVVRGRVGTHYGVVA